MKVKIGNKVYDSSQEPIMIILEPRDKHNIANMRQEDDCYVLFPDTEEYKENEFSKIKEFVKITSD